MLAAQMTWTAEHNERQRQRPVVRLPRDDDLLDEQEREGLLVHMPPHPRPEECCSSTRSDRGASLTAWKQLVEIFQIAVPTALGNLSEFLPITFAMSMVGRLNVGGDGLQLDALAMANSYWNMTGLAVQYGLNSAMRTLAPHAVGSGRSRELSGIHAQRAALIAVVALVPSVVLGSYADRILMLAGQPPDLALLAREYVLLVQPALAGIALMTILQRVLQAEGHILANFYISFAVFLAAPVVQYALIDRMGWGLHGAGIAFSIYNCLYLLLSKFNAFVPPAPRSRLALTVRDLREPGCARSGALHDLGRPWACLCSTQRGSLCRGPLRASLAGRARAVLSASGVGIHGTCQHHCWDAQERAAAHRRHRPLS